MDLKRRRIRQLGLQFRETVLVLASFLGAGYSLENGPAVGMVELEGLYGKERMITREFTIPGAGIGMSKQSEQPLMELGSRSGLEDVDNSTQIFVVARGSGGELVGIIHYTARIIRDEVQVQGEIHTMTASRVFKQRIVNGIPFLTTLYTDFTSPGFFRVTHETVMGRCTMTVCLAIYTGALALAKKILEIEV